jgi:ankyrin repeat protein
VKNNHGRTPFHRASLTGHVEVVKYLVGAGCDKNDKDNDGWTPLHWAS